MATGEKAKKEEPKDPEQEPKRRLHVDRDLPVVAVGPVEAEKMFGIGRNLLYRYIRSGELPSSKVGNRRIIQISDMLAFLDARKLDVSKE